MTSELFEGSPDQLQARLTAIIGGGATINQVMLTHVKGKYIILYT